MAKEIFSGVGTSVFYNTDTGNKSAASISAVQLDELASFPSFGTSNETHQIESYDSEYQRVMIGQQSISTVEVVVNYIPTNTTHIFFDEAFKNKTNFQLQINYVTDEDLGSVETVILNGLIAGKNLSGSKDEVVTMTYLFVPNELVSSGTMAIPPNLRRNDYGVGSNGSTDYPQYEPTDGAEGNAFVKMTAGDVRNPVGVDLMGVELVDGDNHSKLLMTEAGDLQIYAQNGSGTWKRLYTADDTDGLYLAMNANLSDLTDNAAARTNISVYSKEETDAQQATITTSISTLSDSTDTRFSDVTDSISTTNSNLTVLSDSTDTRFNDVTESISTTNTSISTLSDNTDSKFTDVNTAIDITNTNLTTLESTVSNLSDAHNVLDGTVATLSDAITSSFVQVHSSIAKIDNETLKIENNLSDVANIDTARTNLNAAKLGSNSDITNLLSLNGSLKLGADGVSDYDAVTLRQARNLVGSGATGPTLNGVMNYGVGTPMMNASRAYIQPYDVALDGQLLNRADYPELWSFAQMVTPITDTAWIGDITKRGMYSSGDGETTFRVPDWNGVQSGSIPGVFFRGGTGAADMTVADSGLPNITGGFRSYDVGGHEAATGAMYDLGTTATGSVQGTSGGWDLVVGIDASRQWAGFGRSTTEVRPRAVSGVWVVRATGGFTATNTYWTVTNSDETTPSANTLVLGGKITSVYTSPELNVSADFVVNHNTSEGGDDGVTRSSQVLHKKDGTTVQCDFDSNGNMGVPNAMFGQYLSMTGANDNSVYNNFTRDIIGGTTRFGGAIRLGFNRINNGYDFYPQRDDNGTTHVFSRVMTDDGSVVATFAKHSDGSYTAYNGSFINGSDERIKDNILKIENPIDKMKSINGYTWTMKSNGTFGIGFIAQEVEKIFPDAVTSGSYSQELPDGSIVENVKALSAGNVAAALHHEAILKLIEMVEYQQNQINDLKTTIQSLQDK
ncbi:tail fiber domain-containing protein [Kluyvera georgiana]|uniref:tail fiber domain-containing protein n=1 Tax=Kluyvera georgiana TaxID=73098 RepID=UPI003AF13E7A